MQADRDDPSQPLVTAPFGHASQVSDVVKQFDFLFYYCAFFLCINKYNLFAFSIIGFMENSDFLFDAGNRKL